MLVCIPEVPVLCPSRFHLQVVGCQPLPGEILYLTKGARWCSDCSFMGPPQAGGTFLRAKHFAAGGVFGSGPPLGSCTRSATYPLDASPIGASGSTVVSFTEQQLS